MLLNNFIKEKLLKLLQLIINKTKYKWNWNIHFLIKKFIEYSNINGINDFYKEKNNEI